MTAGCKNTTPLPPHATLFYATQLACCKGAYSGQISNACIKGLPSPPTKLPVLKPSSKPSQIAGITIFAPTSLSPTTSTATPTASPSQSPMTSTATLTASPSQASTNLTGGPGTASPSLSPTTSTATPTASPSQPPTTSSPTEIPSNTPTASPSQSPTVYCFPNTTTLKTAVDNYINEGCETTNTTCATHTQYGLIGDRCVKLVTDMTSMFHGKATFNSNISNWRVNLTNMERMFSGASIFNQEVECQCCDKYGWYI